MAIKFINMTPHPIVLNDGTTFAPSGQVARVASKFREAKVINDCECDICRNGGGEGCLSNGTMMYDQFFGDVTGLPPEEVGQMVIVSAMVLSAAKSLGREDCVAPATGHPECRRNEKGHIVSVPGFVR